MRANLPAGDFMVVALVLFAIIQNMDCNDFGDCSFANIVHVHDDVLTQSANVALIVTFQSHILFPIMPDDVRDWRLYRSLWLMLMSWTL